MIATSARPPILDGAQLIGRHGGIVEVRILKTSKGTVSGYFDSPEVLARAVKPWDGLATIYVTANPVHPALLARATNRLREFARETTADREIERRAWFLTDFDPVRPAGISSTDGELAVALERRNEVVAFLTELGFPSAVTAMSGNGAHAMWPIDASNDEPTTKLFERCLKALKAKFGDQVVSIDEAVFNAARIWKLYGTVAVKGDALDDRPHRRAFIEHRPLELVNLEREQLETLAAMAPVERTYSAPGNGVHREALDVGEAFKARGWYLRPLRDGKHAVRCPWASEHSGESGLTETAIFEPREAGGAWGFDCRHQHCASRRIREVYALLRPLDPRPRESASPGGDESNASAGAAINVATIGEILAVEPAALMTKFIVEPWVPSGGFTILTAKSGTGKGKLAQALCLARASGGTWLGVAVQPGPALFWSAEQGKREDFRVTQALCRGLGLTEPSQFKHYFGVIYDPTMKLSAPRMLAEVLALARAHPELMIVIDSLRRAFVGEDTGSDGADDFYSSVISPLRAVGATVIVLGHPPKTSGQQRRIDDENMVRGSGDFIAQLDSLLVLRPVDRTRHDPHTETIVTRLKHPKARGSGEAPPHLVTMHVTHDRTPLVAFELTAKITSTDDTTAAEVAGAVKAAAALFEDRKRLSRKAVLETLQATALGRPACEAALTKLVDLGVIRGPLGPRDRQKGERGHWFAFIKPLPADPEAGREGEDDTDDL